MEVPIWRRIGTNGGYNKSVAEVVIAEVAEDMVAGCVESMTVPEEVDKM